MKCRTVIDRERDEEVVIYVREKSRISEEIERFVSNLASGLIGFEENEIVPINVNDVYCFTVEDGRVYALTNDNKLRLKQRLYEIEDIAGADFLKINQSCLIRVDKIKKFDASLTGGLSVILKNGYKDYISRRQLKTVKERIGF